MECTYVKQRDIYFHANFKATAAADPMHFATVSLFVAGSIRSEPLVHIPGGLIKGVARTNIVLASEISQIIKRSRPP